jgi:cytochrome P450
MLNVDPPDHTRLRGLVRRAFSPRLVEQLGPRMQHIADQLLDAVAGSGRMDLIDDYAFPLPIMVISELLGVPLLTASSLDTGPTLSLRESPSRLESQWKPGGERH